MSYSGRGFWRFCGLREGLVENVTKVHSLRACTVRQAKILDHEVVQLVAAFVFSGVHFADVRVEELRETLLGFCLREEIVVLVREAFLGLFVCDQVLEGRVAGDIVETVRVRVAAVSELEAEPVVEGISVVFGNDMAHHVLHDQLDTERVHEDGDVWIALDPRTAEIEARALLRVAGVELRLVTRRDLRGANPSEKPSL